MATQHITRLIWLLAQHWMNLLIIFFKRPSFIIVTRLPKVFLKNSYECGNPFFATAMCQFPQRFKSSFCANILVPKSTNLKCKYKKSSVQNFHTKFWQCPVLLNQRLRVPTIEGKILCSTHNDLRLFLRRKYVFMDINSSSSKHVGKLFWSNVAKERVDGTSM